MKYWAWIVVALVLYGCDTRREIIEEEYLQVNVSVDWSEADLAPDGTSFWFFPQAEGQRPVVYQTNGTTGNLSLPQGNYSILVFNEGINEHDYIKFRGTNSFSTFEAYLEELQLGGKYAASKSRDGEKTVARPNILAVECRENLAMTRVATTNGKSMELSFAPKRVVIPVLLTVRVRGMDNTASGGHTASLRGMAGNYMLGQSVAGNIPVAHLFTLNNRTFDADSWQNGTMSATFFSFGRVMPFANQVVLYFKLRDGSDFIVERDVTSLLKEMDTDKGRCLTLEMGKGTAEDPIIEIPYVEDSGESGSGFDANVEEWGEEEIIDL